MGSYTDKTWRGDRAPDSEAPEIPESLRNAVKLRDRAYKAFHSTDRVQFAAISKERKATELIHAVIFSDRALREADRAVPSFFDPDDPPQHREQEMAEKIRAEMVDLRNRVTAAIAAL